MGDQTQPLDRRAQTIADLWELFNFLDGHSDVPLGASDPLSYSVRDYDSDAEAVDALAAIATALGVEITDVGGRVPKPGNTHFYARKVFGTAKYEAHYITQQHTAEYAEEQKWVAERRGAVSE